MEVVRELQKKKKKKKTFKMETEGEKQFLPIKSSSVGSSLYGFHGRVILLSRVPRKSKLSFYRQYIPQVG
jgi:hypothetical protein